MAHEIKIPSVGESITSATLGAWHKAEGDYVKAGEVILTIETDKITTELESDRSGILHHLAAVGDELAIGAPVASVEEGDAPADAPAESSDDASAGKAVADAAPIADAAPVAAEDSPSPSIKATPVARKIAEGEGIDLSRVSGSGAGRRENGSDAGCARFVRPTACGREPGFRPWCGVRYGI